MLVEVVVVQQTVVVPPLLVRAGPVVEVLGDDVVLACELDDDEVSELDVEVVELLPPAPGAIRNT